VSQCDPRILFASFGILWSVGTTGVATLGLDFPALFCMLSWGYTRELSASRRWCWFASIVSYVSHWSVFAFLEDLCRRQDDKRRWGLSMFCGVVMYDAVKFGWVAQASYSRFCVLVLLPKFQRTLLSLSSGLKLGRSQSSWYTSALTDSFFIRNVGVKPTSTQPKYPKQVQHQHPLFICLP